MELQSADRRVLDALKSHGANLAKPTKISHYFIFTSKRAAEAASAELSALNYSDVVIQAVSVPSLWKRLFGPRKHSCVVKTQGVLSEEQVAMSTQRMTQIATKYGGHYDGWEAAIAR